MPLLSPFMYYVVAMIGFDQTQYSVTEGEVLEAMVNIVLGVVLERDVVVTVESSDGTARGMKVVSYNEWMFIPPFVF